MLVATVLEDGALENLTSVMRHTNPGMTSITLLTIHQTELGIHMLSYAFKRRMVSIGQTVPMSILRQYEQSGSLEGGPGRGVKHG